MNLVEFLTAVGVLGIIVIFILKAYNLINYARVYGVDKSILTFVAALLMYFLALIGGMTIYTIYAAAYLKIAAVLLVTLFLMTIAEILLTLSKTVIKPMMPLRR